MDVEDENINTHTRKTRNISVELDNIVLFLKSDAFCITRLPNILELSLIQTWQKDFPINCPR